MYLLCTFKNEIISIGTLNSTAVGPGRGESEPHLAICLLSPALSSCGKERENTSFGQAVVVSRRAPSAASK
jgi:hypothetical protein